MSYSTRDDLEAQYGRSNILKWADLDNTGDEDTIATRINWALNRAYNDLNDRLRDGPYEVPFATPPQTIIEMEASLAGVHLYESRGVIDYDANDKAVHQLQHQKNDVEMKIRGIHARKIKFNLVTPVSYPQVVND